MTWLKSNITPATVVKIILTIITAVGFVLILDFRVQDVETTQTEHINDYKQFRYQSVPDTYMRKDVAEQVIIRLERIEHKIDNMNER